MNAIRIRPVASGLPRADGEHVVTAGFRAARQCSLDATRLLLTAAATAALTACGAQRYAGESYWNGVTSLNARSIGIEIINGSRCVAVERGLEHATPANQQCEFREFEPAQIGLVIGLLQDILERYPRINAVDIVGHADVAPARRADPGPTFPWRLLHEHGIGAWYDQATVARYRAVFEAAPPSLVSVQRALAAYGYGVEATGVLDAQTRFALRAFQMHFRPSRWSGKPDAGTAAILFALVEKYRPAELSGLGVAAKPNGEHGSQR